MTRASNRTLLFFLLAAISMALLILSSTGAFDPAEGVVGQVIRPLLLFSNGAGMKISEAVSTARNLTTLRGQNQALQSQVDTLTIDNLRVQELEAENQQLRELLRFRQLNPGYDFRGGQVIARVTSQSPSNYRRTLNIDLGKNHGIERGMPVVNEAGLVGRIDKVGPDWAVVLLITDSSSAVDALIQRSSSRAVGVLQGVAGNKPVMDYIAQEADIAVGDVVETSGLGGNFPKGLKIGQVEKVNQRDFDMYQQAVVRPTVNFDRLEFIMVITNFKPQPGQPDELQSVG